MSELELPSVLYEWIVETVGEPTGTRRLAGGNRRQAWEIDVAGRELFLRYDANLVPADDDPFTVRREAGIYAGLADSSVLLPGLIAVHPQLDAMLVERIPGSASYRAIGQSREKQDIANQYMREIAKLHAVNLESIELGLGRAKSISDSIADDITQWEGMYRSSGRLDPLIEFALRWLRANLPAIATPPVLVHGDAGPGNFLFSDGRVTALLDWELAHFGDPVEDLAWVSMRSVLEPIPDFAEAVTAYVEASGNAIEPARLNFHRVFVQWRIAIIRHRRAGADLANSLMSQAVSRRLLVEVLATVTGQPITRGVLPEPDPTPRTPLFDSILETLQDNLVPAISGTRASAKAKSVARVVKYLRELDRSGPSFEKAERADLERLLGEWFRDIMQGRHELGAAIRAGRISESAVFPYLAAQSWRETMLMRDPLGRLVDCTFPSLQRSSEIRTPN